MRMPILALALLAVAPPRAEAAAFTCSGPVPNLECADHELLTLDKAVDVRFEAVVAQADPLMKLLLQRDQDWFAEIVARGSMPKYQGPDDPQRLRLKDTLARRLHTLNAINPRAAAGSPAGTWGNALATVTVGKAGGDALRVTLAAKLAYEEGDDTLTCHLAGTFKDDGRGWFAGEFASRDAGERARASLRLQGNTLRIIRTYDPAPAPDANICGNLAIITGSYFPMTPAGTAAFSVIAARTVSPSFKCATAKNSDEKEICADPELAARDAEIARVYAETLRRLEPQVGAQLRADQRSWVKDNPTAYDGRLHPGWNKTSYYLHDTDVAREELMLRLDERLAMLANFDEKRQGLVGLWEAYNAALTIAPTEGKTDGTVTAEGFKWEVGDYKSHCDFKSDGLIVRGAFEAREAFPTLTRDGAMLITSAEDPDDKPRSSQPDYCSRMPSTKARLFPVKLTAGVRTKFDRIR